MTENELFAILYEDTPKTKACNIIFRMSLAEILPVGGTPMTVTEIQKLYAEKTNINVSMQKITANLIDLLLAGIVERDEVSRRIKKIYLKKRTADGKWIPAVNEVKVKRCPVYHRVK